MPHKQQQPNIASSYIIQNSPFLLLPSELRNLIYTHVFAPATYKLGRQNSSNKIHIIRTRNKDAPKPHYLALLAVCCQVRYETAPLPLQLGTVHINSLLTLDDLVRMNPPDDLCKAITHLHIHIRGAGNYYAKSFIVGVERSGIELLDVLPGVRRVVLDMSAKGSPDHELYGGLIRKWIQKSGGVALEVPRPVVCAIREVGTM
jgi:hypothetical protein